MKTQTQTLNAFVIPTKLTQIIKITKTIGIITTVIFAGIQIQGFFVDRALMMQESDYAVSSSAYDTQNNIVTNLRSTLSEEEKILATKAVDRCNKFRALKAYKVSKGIALKSNDNPCVGIDSDFQ